jgi:hypothetical protein
MKNTLNNKKLHQYISIFWRDIFIKKYVIDYAENLIK